jgi:DNA adenine methylase
VTLKAPFPWFGGKSRAASEVWAALGDVRSYVEPFGGSAALLLARPPGWSGVETYNDADGLLCNFWRGVKLAPEAVAEAADWPVSEADLHARHLRLVEQRESVTERLIADPEWCDPKLAGWWAWGASCWIGSGWCSGDGPWARTENGMEMVGDAGQGVHRKLPHLGNAGRGVIASARTGVHGYMMALHERLRRVRVTCGDWTRVTTFTVVEKGTGHYLQAGVVLDPPYPEGWDADAAYVGQTQDAASLCAEVFASALDLSERGVRVVVCGYSGTWAPPKGWTERPWKARKGYAKSGVNENHRREVLWCSPACVPVKAPGLFG